MPTTSAASKVCANSKVCPISPPPTLTAILPQAPRHPPDPTDLHTRLLLRRLRLLRVDDALLDIPREAEKSLFDVDIAFRGDLHERDPELVGQRLALLGGNGAFLLPVALIADEDFVDAFGGVLLDVGEPGSDV